MGPMRRIALVGLGGLLALATACEGGGAAAAAPTVKAGAKATAEASKPSAPMAEVPYNYDPVGKRDPFRSPVEEQSSPSNETSPCSEPLCQWELDQLTLVAIVTGDANPIGMVEDPQGRGYIIRRNSKIGRRGGKVTQIMRGSITVTELLTGQDGKVSTNPQTLALKSDKQSLPEIDLSTGAQYQ